MLTLRNNFVLFRENWGSNVEDKSDRILGYGKATENESKKGVERDQRSSNVMNHS